MDHFLKELKRLIEDATEEIHYNDFYRFCSKAKEIINNAEKEYYDNE
jgi:hypothetical protein